MDNYDIRYDDKYGQLTHIDLAAEGAAHDPWFNQTLTTVSDCVIRLAVIDGRLVDWHKHEHEDEFFLVLEGRLELEVEGREPFVLGPRQGVTIPRGIVHRPHALGRTVVLMVEPAHTRRGASRPERESADERRFLQSPLTDSNRRPPSLPSSLSGMIG
jgi:mannose-6-phosphate isomerase-like protein (cupin superfamily)